MARITLDDGAAFDCAAGETLLRAGLRAGFGMPYECNAGGCGTCKVDVVSGAVEDLWPQAPGLSDRDRRKGRVLACQSRPRGDCAVKVRQDPACVPPVPPARRRAVLDGGADVTHDIRAFRFRAEGAADFLPGQYVMLALPDGLERAYSLANLPNPAGVFEVMVRRVPGGRMTERLFAAPPAEVSLDGPFGLAHLRPSARDIVCLAGGSGLAPMLSIARAVAAQETPRRVVFFHGGRAGADVMDVARLDALTGLGARLTYVPVVSGERVRGLAHGLVHEVAAAWLAGSIDTFDYYCAGPPPMMQALETLLVREAGLPAGRVRFDRFF
ncbi:2Fe-2S iron-sulfur cluster binding domain-containing protein [Xanthobacter sp. V4C-4]|uniref:2Fe-2S iron-sulfur cluster-binding protein n=1 Tax=Xanthobacter cornucopiae TaxID=3119924 RepID=UPI00372C18A8